MASLEAIATDLRTLWNSVVLQGEGLQKLEALATKIREAVNNQANGVRNLEMRVAQLESVLMRVAQGNGRPAPQPMRTINRPPLRALPSVNKRKDFIDVDDASADADYEYDEDEQDVG